MRVLELTFTSHSLACFAHDFGYDGPPFPCDECRRARLRADLDAWYARAYGLTRDELRYIDPADVMGEDYPSEVTSSRYPSRRASVGSTRTARRAGPAADNRPMVMMKMAAAGRIPGMCHPPSTSMFILR
jgi:hypothetical protein